MSIIAQHLFSDHARRVRREFIMECVRDAAAEVKRAVEWMATPEGQKAAAEAKLRGDDTRALFEKGKNIDWRTLNDPFTI